MLPWPDVNTGEKTVLADKLTLREPHTARHFLWRRILLHIWGIIFIGVVSEEGDSESSGAAKLSDMGGGLESQKHSHLQINMTSLEP